MLNDFKPGCCELGSNCGLPCAVSEYQCQTTITASGTATASATCCPRACSTGSFKCAAALGGQCCPYDSACGSGTCISTAKSTTSPPTVAPLVPSGCPTSQIACASSIGGGCCNNDATCTVVSGTNYCAKGTVSAIRTGPNGTTTTGLPETNKSSGLSAGAKAGIGGGIGALALLIAGGVLYFCMLQRRKARHDAEAEESVPAMSQTSGTRTNISGGTKGRPVPLRRQTADYFGPDATAGPYTDTSPTSSPGYTFRGVPITPQSPGDIAVPVELDSSDHRATKKSESLRKIVELP